MTTETKDAKLDDVMQRIAKIRALAERAGTQDEAEVAASKMNELLLKYNLTLGDVERHAQATNRTVAHELYKSGQARWKIDLLFVVAKAHMCKGIYHQGGSRRLDGKGGAMTVVGHEHNLIVVRETWHWLMKVCSNLDGPAADLSGIYWQGGRAAIAAWMRDFRMGFVEGIRVAYEAMREQVKAATDPGEWAIVPVIDQEVMTVYNQLFPRTGTRSGATIRNGDAFGQGKQAGLNTNLSRQVGGSRSNPAIAG